MTTSSTPAASMRPRTVDVVGGPVVIYESADVNKDLDDAIARGTPAPYGRVLWSSAPAVASVLPSLSPTGLAGMRVLELGCGTGLVSLVAARLGASVLATDVDEGALASVAHAAREASLAVDTALFDVCSADPLPASDVVVVADLMYEAPLAAAIARRTVEAKQRGSRVVLGDPGRVFRVQLERLLREAGVVVEFRASEGDVAVAVI